MRKRASGFDKKCLFNNFKLLRIKLFLLLGLKKNKIRLKKFCQNHRPIVNYRPNIMISTGYAWTMFFGMGTIVQTTLKQKGRGGILRRGLG